ncbi:GM20422 [Drosophila sechellia]|uniref:GM20422 n=1 Tax=Drosophila sechellia TaxID=7238 RepID=B4HNJ0_DROSE|nr:GM20422 [Drosophila sechellia]
MEISVLADSRPHRQLPTNLAQTKSNSNSKTKSKTKTKSTTNPVGRHPLVLNMEASALIRF